MADLDSTRRGELTGTAAALAHTLDDWLFSQHGVTSGAHAVGPFLELAAAYGLAVVPRSAATVYADHQAAGGGCSCGWAELGKSYFGHLDEMLREAGDRR